MKIEQVIVLHLINNKEVTLQGIGTFRLNSSVPLPTDSEKDVVIPENAVSFEYNPRAAEDASLIDSIVKHTTKIKPLASADLDSFLILGKQFLNIGKPFTLDKLGTLDKAQTGELVFIPGEFVTPKIETPKALKENEDEEISGLFNDYNREPENNNKRIFIIIALCIIAALAAWAIYYFMFSKKPAETNNASVIQKPSYNDSILPAKDSPINTFTVDTVKNKVINESSFNIIIRQTDNKKEAINYFNKLKLWGHKMVLQTADSIHFKIMEVIDLPLSDTARVRDSLSRFYQTPVYVELK